MMDAPRTFLSTPSVRRATSAKTERQRKYNISIHALREEGDAVVPGTTSIWNLFLSTPSMRRATQLPDR